MQRLKEQMEKSKSNQVDSVLKITQLKGNKFDAFQFDVRRCFHCILSFISTKGKDSSRLNRVTQLTGYSDPVYVEAVNTGNEFYFLLDILVEYHFGY